MSKERPKVLVTSPTLDFVKSNLDEAYEVVCYWEQPRSAPLAGIRALTCLGNEKLAPVMERMPDLELAACFTTGYDGVDLELCRSRGIAVTHAPGASAPAVAEFALALTLALVRNVVIGQRIVLRGEWREGAPLIGGSLRGSRVGVVGLGDIGRTFAGYAQTLGAEVSWWGPRPKPQAEWPRAASLEALVRDSDVIVVCARAEASNRHLISAEVLAHMRPHALLVNVARGQLIDEDALLECLREGRIGGAALDVFETEPTPASRWADAPNVIVTPHIGGATRQTAMAMLAMLRENLDRFFAGAPLATPVVGMEGEDLIARRSRRPT